MIQFLTLPAQTVYCRKGAFNGVEERKEFLREVFMEAIHLYGSDSSKRMFFIEYNLEHPEEFTCCISVPPASKGEHVVHLPEQNLQKIQHALWLNIHRLQLFLLYPFSLQFYNLLLDPVFQYRLIQQFPKSSKPHGLFLLISLDGQPQALFLSQGFHPGP